MMCNHNVEIECSLYLQKIYLTNLAHKRLMTALKFMRKIEVNQVERDSASIGCSFNNQNIH